MLRCGRCLPIAGWPEERANAVEMTGGTDPILPTSFRIGETATAALAATGLAVSDLWELRTGRGQDIGVDARQATASLRSSHYLQMDDTAVSTERNTIMGTYPARDGRWSYLHCNFPNHRAAALSVLGCRRIGRRCVRQYRSGTRWSLRRRSSPQGRWRMVRTMDEWPSIRRRTLSPPCR